MHPHLLRTDILPAAADCTDRWSVHHPAVVLHSLTHGNRWLHNRNPASRKSKRDRKGPARRRYQEPMNRAGSASRRSGPRCGNDPRYEIPDKSVNHILVRPELPATLAHPLFLRKRTGMLPVPETDIVYRGAGVGMAHTIPSSTIRFPGPLLPTRYGPSLKFPEHRTRPPSA